MYLLIHYSRIITRNKTTTFMSVFFLFSFLLLLLLLLLNVHVASIEPQSDAEKRNKLRATRFKAHTTKHACTHVAISTFYFHIFFSPKEWEAFEHHTNKLLKSITVFCVPRSFQWIIQKDEYPYAVLLLLFIFFFCVHTTLSLPISERTRKRNFNFDHNDNNFNNIIYNNQICDNENCE